MRDNSRAIHRIFTKGVFNDLLSCGRNDIFDYVVTRTIQEPENMTHGEIISEIYSHLGSEKRNQYYYMNTLLNRLLVSNKHNVNTTTALSQVRIDQHIADFVLINGEAVVYEIKSDLDNFDRLYDQLSDYFKAFRKVSVLLSCHDFGVVERMSARLGDMGDAVGFYSLSENNTLFGRNSQDREPKNFDDYLNHASIFKLMRKREYENVLMKYFDELPKVEPVFYFKACLVRFTEIPILDAYRLTCEELKRRNKIDVVTFRNIQKELRSVIYFSGLERKMPELELLLQTKYKG